jgi:hypothetical protein
MRSTYDQPMITTHTRGLSSYRATASLICDGARLTYIQNRGDDLDNNGSVEPIVVFCDLCNSFVDDDETLARMIRLKSDMR